MIDITKTYITTSGKTVKIYSTDGVGCYKVHGAVLRTDGMWYWYEYKPVITNHYSDWWFNFEGGRVAAAQFSEPWESSLEARPKAKAKPVKKQAKKTKKKGKKK